VEVVQAVMVKDHRLSVRMTVEETGLDKNAVHRILTDHLHMRKICAKLVPKNLFVEQKVNRLEIYEDLLGRLEIEPNLLDKVITGDDSSVFDYDPETKRQSEEWHTQSSPRPKKAHMSRSRVKTLIIVFFDSRGIVHKEFVPPGLTVNHAFYSDVLEHCRRLGAAPRQRASSHCTFSSRISGKEKRTRTSTSSLQPRASSVRFLPLP